MGMDAEGDNLHGSPAEPSLPLFSIDPTSPGTELAILKEGISLLYLLSQLALFLQFFISGDPIFFFFGCSRRGGRGEEQGASKKDSVLDEIPAGESHGDILLKDPRSFNSLQYNSGIHGQSLILVSKHRIQFHLLDLRILMNEARYFQNHFNESRDACGFLSPVSLQQGESLDLSNHLLSISPADGNNPERYILQDLNKNTAHAEHDDRPELRIFAGSYDDLCSRRSHFLDGDSMDESTGDLLFDGS
jgi:hypothetical protein